MKTWNVSMDGLGGPTAEFIYRRYEVDAETPGAAVDAVMPAFLDDIEKVARSYSEYRPYFFHSATVHEVRFGVRRLDGSRN